MWLEQVKTVDSSRKRGAAKAAETRRLNRCPNQAAKVYSCKICGAMYDDDTEDAEFWVGCDNCDIWFHGTLLMSQQIMSQTNMSYLRVYLNEQRIQVQRTAQKQCDQSELRK